MTMKKTINLVLFATIFIFVSSATQAFIVSFAWDANPPEDGVIGYEIHFGRYILAESGDFECTPDGISSTKGESPINIPLSSLDDPDNPSYILDGLMEGMWCFYFTAYNSNGEEGTPSPIIFYALGNDMTLIYSSLRDIKPEKRRLHRHSLKEKR
jgi:hypothetical protein